MAQQQGWAVTVQLVGPNWGQDAKHQSATVLRRNAARARVQEEWQAKATLRGCSGAEMRLALRSQSLAFRRSAGHAELVALTERSLPWADSGGTDEMDSVTCTGCDGSWVAADVRAFVSSASGVVERRLQRVYARDAVMSEQATFNALGVQPGSLLQIVVASEAPGGVPAPARPQSAANAVLRQRAQDEKKKHVATVRALFNEGVSKQQQQEWRLAANSYSQAIIASRADDPALQSLLSNRGLCRARLGEWRSAYLDHNRALVQAASMHGRTLHYLNRGLCGLRLGMLEEAHDDFESAFLHGSGTVSTGAAKQMQKLKAPLYQACEAQFEWLRQYYPSILRSTHCNSVEAFRALCTDVRDRLGREYGSGNGKPLAERHDRCQLVHTEALATICKDQDFNDPTPITEGARGEFERILKESTKRLLDEMEREEGKQQGAAGAADGNGVAAPAGGRGGAGGGSGGAAGGARALSPGRETLHETEKRLAKENSEKWEERQAAMTGNVAQGFVLVRDTDEMMRINHRSRSSRQQEAASIGKVKRPATAPVSRSEESLGMSSMADVVMDLTQLSSKQRMAMAVDVSSPRPASSLIAAAVSPSAANGRAAIDLRDGFSMVFEMMEDKKLRSADLFNSLDRDSGGTVDASELREAFARHGVELKEPEANALLTALDQDGDGKVDKKEFIEEMRSMKRAIARGDPILSGAPTHQTRSSAPVVHEHQQQQPAARPQSAMAAFSSVSSPSLETTFRQMLPVSISQPFERPSTATSDNIIAQRRSIAKLSAGHTTKTPVGKVMVGGVAMESPQVVKAREQRMKRARRETERRLARTSGMRGGDGVNTPSTSQLHDDRSYKAKVRGAGQLCVGRAERVTQMGLSADTVSMNDLLGDWTKAKAISYFLEKSPGGGVVATGPAASTNWAAWQAELSWRRYAEDPSQGNSLNMRGHKAPVRADRQATCWLQG